MCRAALFKKWFSSAWTLSHDSNCSLRKTYCEARFSIVRLSGITRRHSFLFEEKLGLSPKNHQSNNLIRIIRVFSISTTRAIYFWGGFLSCVILIAWSMIVAFASNKLFRSDSQNMRIYLFCGHWSYLVIRPQIKLFTRCWSFLVFIHFVAVNSVTGTFPEQMIRMFVSVLDFFCGTGEKCPISSSDSMIFFSCLAHQ